MSPDLRGVTANYLLTPSQAGSAVYERGRPLAFLDLTLCPEDFHLVIHAPYPIIGVGPREHPVAAVLDAVIEPPITAQQLIENIELAPHAAAAIAQLLRTLEGMSLEHALTVESFCYGMLQGSAEYAKWLRSRGEPVVSVPGNVRIERNEAVLNVTLDRPNTRNAIDRGMRDQLYEAFTVAGADKDIEVVKLRGEGVDFSAGADLSEFGTTVDPSTAHSIRHYTLPARSIIHCANRVDVHVQGACIGAGLELAAFAGRMTADPQAWFWLPELAMGLLPGAGGCVSVPRRIGRQRAALLILSGQKIDAATALRWGLVDRLEVGGKR